MGYFTCLLLWAWTAVLYMPIILSNEQVKEFLLPVPAKEATAPTVTAAPSPATLIFALIITIAVIGVTVFVLLRVPVAIAKTGKTITTKAADSAVPLITRGKPLPVKEKRRLTVRLVKYIKLLLVLLPVIALCLSVSVQFALAFDLVILVASLLAAVALFWFSLQYVSARLLRVKLDTIV